MTKPRDQRQDQLDRITARYEEEFRAGANPRLEDYVRRYPEFADELIEFALYFAAVTAQLPEDDFAPADQLSVGSQAALAAVRAELGLPAEAPSPTPAASPAVESLFRRGVALGLAPRQLAAATELSTDLLAKLEDRAIAAASIPHEAFEVLARALQTGAEAVRAFLAGPRDQARAGAQLYLAERPPEYPQESFAAAVRGSTLAPEQQRRWTDAVQREGLPN